MQALSNTDSQIASNPLGQFHNNSGEFEYVIRTGIGRIGKSGTPFLVGPDHDLDFQISAADTAGGTVDEVPLWLAFKDTAGAFVGNTGSWHVTIIH